MGICLRVWKSLPFHLGKHVFLTFNATNAETEIMLWMARHFPENIASVTSFLAEELLMNCQILPACICSSPLNMNFQVRSPRNKVIKFIDKDFVQWTLEGSLYLIWILEFRPLTVAAVIFFCPAVLNLFSCG